ncbi:MAG TPA: hypothetical protein PKI73_04480 [Petrotogaceae bacterium]|nr:hypothetical protein [Petrotogaceae bacterium]
MTGKRARRDGSGENVINLLIIRKISNFNLNLNKYNMKVHVSLHQTKEPDGWCASIATARASKGAKNEVAIGESEIYPDKEAAWNSIQKSAQKLDYANDEIYLNAKKVKDYSDLETKVGAL